MPMSVDDAMAMFRDLLSELGREETAGRLSADTTVKELDLDSLEILEFLMLVDDRAGVEIEAEEAGFDTSVGVLAELISQRSS